MGQLFVIGLGGTGIKTLLHVKKALCDRDPSGSLPNNVRILGIDTFISPETISNIGIFPLGKNEGTQTTLELEKDNYVALTGDLRGWVTDDDLKIEDPRFDWFDHSYFTQPLKWNFLNLQEGAGMYRQIGRLAFYQHTADKNLKLYWAIERKLHELAVEGNPIQVLVCGSLAGGTGAGIFLDVANLVRKISNNRPEITVTIMGLFALPDAFRGNSDSWQLINDMKPRTFAALRELERFLTQTSINNGSATWYGVNANDSRFPDRIGDRDTVYDWVWLFDERLENPLDVPIEKGIAPTIANYISLMQNVEFSEWMRIHLSSIYHECYQSHRIDLGMPKAYVGSFGTYSVELPISSIIERWACRISQEVIDELVPLDEEGQYKTNNPEGIWGDTGAYALQDSEEWRKYRASLLLDAGTLGAEYDPKHPRVNAKVLERLLNRLGEPDWASVLLHELDEDEQQAHWRSLWESYFYDPKCRLKGALVQKISKKYFDGDTERAAISLVRECKRIEDALLNDANEFLYEKFYEQYEKFCEELQNRIRVVLNGNCDDTWENAISNKSGKLGWLLDYLQGMHRRVENARLILRDALESMKARITIQRDTLELGSASTTNSAASYVQAMKKNERKQKDYLKKRQELFELKRWYLMANSEYRYLGVFQHHLKTSLQGLKDIVRALSTDRDASIRRIAVDHKRRVKTIEDDARAEMEKVKRIIDLNADQESQQWEYNKYQYFAEDAQNGPTVKKVLRDVAWNVDNEGCEIDFYDPLHENARKIKAKSMNVSLFVDGFEKAESGILLTNQINGIPKAVASDKDRENLGNANFMRFRARCMKELSRAWEELSVLDYLNTIYNDTSGGRTVEEFVTEMITHGGVLLKNHPEVPPTRTDVYLVRPHGNGEQVGWCDRVMDNLKDNLHAKGNLSRYLEINNKSTLYFFSMRDLVNLHDLSVYHEGSRKYFSLPCTNKTRTGERSVQHIFTEEQNAAPYFDPAKPLSPRVVAILGDMHKVDMFLTTLALGLLVEVKEGDERFVQINTSPGNEDVVDGKCRVCDFSWRLTEKIPFREMSPYHVVTATLMCTGEGAVGPEGLSICELWKRLEQYLPEVILAGIEKMVPVWEEQAEKGSLTTLAQQALQVKSGALRDKLLERAYRLQMDVDLKQRLKKELEKKRAFLEDHVGDAQGGIPRDGFTVEIVYLKDEINFLEWMLVRLDERIAALSEINI